MAQIERRVYVGHKLHGTCVTYEARVYIAPKCVQFPPKSVPRINFTVSSEGLVDPDGQVWACGGENPGCGPRLPKELKDRHGKEFSQMTHAERKDFLKSLVPTNS